MIATNREVAAPPFAEAIPVTITLAQLKSAGACSDQVAIFKVKFGKSVVVTEAVALEVANSFDWNWAAAYLLSAPALAEYERVCAPALAEYERVRAPALAEYERVCAPALAEYERVCAPAWAEYERVSATALAEYDRVRAPALAEYERVRATTFARLYIAQGGAK
jgi:hypothetical protein